jgi:hypothetical protein
MVVRLEQLQGLIVAQPFRPFVIHLPLGRKLPIVHHDFAIIAPDRRNLFAYQADMSFDMIDIMLITDIEVSPPSETAAATGANGPAAH